MRVDVLCGVFLDDFFKFFILFSVSVAWKNKQTNKQPMGYNRISNPLKTAQTIKVPYSRGSSYAHHAECVCLS